MYQIKLGLEQNIDVSIYANSKIDWKQMEEIRKRLEKEKLENEQKNI